MKLTSLAICTALLSTPVSAAMQFDFSCIDADRELKPLGTDGIHIASMIDVNHYSYIQFDGIIYSKSSQGDNLIIYTTRQMGLESNKDSNVVAVQQYGELFSITENKFRGDEQYTKYYLCEFKVHD